MLGAAADHGGGIARRDERHDRPPVLAGRRAALMGLDLGRSHTVLAARCRGGHHRRAIADAAAAYAAHASGLAGEYRGNVIVLLPGDQDPAQTARTVARHLSQAVGDAVTIGSAAAVAGIDALIEAHREASQCLDVLLALNRDGQGASRNELGVYGLLLSQAGHEEVGRFVRRTIGPVLDYDDRRGGELVRTLQAYFDCRRLSSGPDGPRTATGGWRPVSSRP